MNADEIKRLREIAEAATPGPWYVADVDGPRGKTLYRVMCSAYEDEEPGVCGDLSKGWPLTGENAEFIARFNPQLVLQLLTELRELRAVAEKAREVVRVFSRGKISWREGLGVLELRELDPLRTALAALAPSDSSGAGKEER